MAEAHAAVAFTFTVSSEGFYIDINKQAWEVVLRSGIHAGKKRIARFKNSVYNQVYPFHPSSWFFFAFGIFAATYLGYDYKRSPIPYIEEALKRYAGFTHYFHVPACLLFSLMLWFCGSFLNQLFLRLLLSYTGWMYKPRGQKSMLVFIWMQLVRLAKSRHSRLYGYQYSLPSLPLPSLRATLDRYLLSVRHLLSVKEFEELTNQSEVFRKSHGRKLQFFLWLKTWFTSNYVSFTYV
ncbi:hypothetical protein AHF37_08062 [Paragonimus kellicotti]|nr:hypothetical protein AHF37_08062 [Paragonimus kellicotti]